MGLPGLYRVRGRSTGCSRTGESGASRLGAAAGLRLVAVACLRPACIALNFCAFRHSSFVCFIRYARSLLAYRWRYTALNLQLHIVHLHLEGSAGKCGIMILNFEKLQKTSDTSQEFMNTMQCSILSGSMSIHTIHTSRVVIHTKNVIVNPVTCLRTQIELWGAHQKLPLNARHVERLCS